VRAHDHRAEGDALLEHLEEVADRDVLAARDAVEVRVEQPDRLHALAPQGRHGGFRVVTDGHRALCLLFGTHPRTRTGIRLTPLKKHERSRTGSPARSTLGRYGIISSSQTLISSFARCIPRQKCGPPRPKVRWRFGVLPTSSRYGSANLASSYFAPAYQIVTLSPSLMRRPCMTTSLVAVRRKWCTGCARRRSSCAAVPARQRAATRR